MVIVLCLVSITILFIVYGYISNFFCQVTEHDIVFHFDLGGFHGKKVVVLSDLHGNSFGKRNGKLIEKINHCHAYYIYVAGDMVVKDGSGVKEGLDLMKQLSDRYPIYYAPGNHETRLEAEAEYIQKLKSMGVVYLDNEKVVLREGSDSLCLSGLNLPEEFYQKIWKQPKLESGDIYNRIGAAETKMPQILLAHSPDFFDTYAKWGADLVISGHLHGGILCLPFGGALAPSLRVFPKYVRGRYQIGKSQMYVSRGLGLHHIKFRFFNLPEVAVLTLTGKQGDYR